MILCIDIGNTNIVCGIPSDLEKYPNIRFKTKDTAYLKELSIYKSFDITGISISSVVPSINENIITACETLFNIEPYFAKYNDVMPIKFAIDEPSTIGSDLFVGMVAASNKYGNPFILVDLGTATKILIVNKNNEFIGASIMPGVKTSLRNLFNNAELLKEFDFKDDLKVVGTNTNDCIGSGVIIGTASLIDEMINRIKEETKESNYKIIITGGLAKSIRKYIHHETTYDEFLLLDGLDILYKLNRME